MLIRSQITVFAYLWIRDYLERKSEFLGKGSLNPKKVNLKREGYNKKMKGSRYMGEESPSFKLQDSHGYGGGLSDVNNSQPILPDTDLGVPTTLTSILGAPLSASHLGPGLGGYPPADEPKYCICQKVSFGIMIGCDNEEVSIYTYTISG